MPRTLTLCLIVKDEEQLLPGCLESVAGLIDELVVVDTGSTDRTIEIALAAGAKVIDEPWTDDFSRARNVGLKHATSDFVFWLDADERLDPACRATLRRLVDSESDEARPTIYAPIIQNLDALGRSLGADHMPRLWRRRPELFFTGRVHERVGVEVPSVLVRYEDDLRILHLGYDPGIAEARGKHPRNLRLLELELKDRPDEPTLLYYVAKEAYATGEDERAADLFRDVVRRAPGLNFALSSYVFGAECLRSLGRAEEALELAIEGARKTPTYSELWYAAGQAALDADRPVQAEALFREAKTPTSGFALSAFRDPDILEYRADVGLGRALKQQGLIPAAVQVWESVRSRVPVGPDRIGLDLDLIEAHLSSGAQDQAWVYLRPLLDLAPEEATGALLSFIELYVQFMGAEKAWVFFTDVAREHGSILRQLPIVAAGIELAELLGDEDRLTELLQIAVHLNTPSPKHYALLARILDGRGQSAAADAARRAAKRMAELSEA